MAICGTPTPGCSCGLARTVNDVRGSIIERAASTKFTQAAHPIRKGSGSLPHSVTTKNCINSGHTPNCLLCRQAAHSRIAAPSTRIFAPTQTTSNTPGIPNTMFPVSCGQKLKSTQCSSCSRTEEDDAAETPVKANHPY